MFEEFKLKNLGDYYDLYIQSDTLLFENVFENFRNKCIEVYKTSSRSSFVSVASLLKKVRSRIRIINRYWYVIDV